MTKEELAKRKGMKINTPNPVEALLNVSKENPIKETLPLPEKPEKKEMETSPEDIEETFEITQPEKATGREKHQEQKNLENKKTKTPGRPKKRNVGDKKISFWLEEDLIEKVYGPLKYGESVGDRINELLRRS